MKQTLCIVILFWCCESFAQSTLWTNPMGGTGYETAKAVCIGEFGSVYTVGTFEGTVDFDPGAGVTNLTSNGAFDIFIQKTDQNGQFYWAKSIGGSGNDEALGIASDQSGRIVVTGYFSNTVDADPGPSVTNLISAGFSDVLVCEFNIAGNFMWAKSIGGTGPEEGFAITLDNNNNVLVTGEFQQTVDFDPGAGVFSLSSPNNSDNAFVLKLNSTGNFVWAAAFGASNVETGFDIITDATGNVYCAGRFTDTVDFDPGNGVYNLISNGAQDGFLVKLSANGNLIRAVQVGGTDGDEAYSVDVNSAGELILAGAFRSTVDLNPGPGVTNVTSQGWTDIFLIKCDTAFNYVWSKTAGDTSFDYCFDVSLDPWGNVYSAGYFSGSVDFDPGAGAALLNANQGYTYIQVLNLNGDYVWAGQSYADISLYYGTCMVADAYGFIYLTGGFWSTYDFDVGAGTLNLSPVGQCDALTLKIALENSGLSSDVTKTQVEIYPNPFSDEIILHVAGTESFTNISVRDTRGELIFTMKCASDNASEWRINMPALPSGFYFLEIVTTEHTYSGKVVRY